MANNFFRFCYHLLGSNESSTAWSNSSREDVEQHKEMVDVKYGLVCVTIVRMIYSFAEIVN